MAIDPQDLRTRINAVPALVTELLPWPGDGNDIRAAQILNMPRPGVASATRGVLPAYQIFDAIDPADYAALAAVERQRIQTMLGMGQINMQGANTRAHFLAAFGVGTATRNNLIGLQTQAASYIEQWYGVGVVVTPDVLAGAR